VARPETPPPTTIAFFITSPFDYMQQSNRDPNPHIEITNNIRLKKYICQA